MGKLELFYLRNSCHKFAIRDLKDKCKETLIIRDPYDDTVQEKYVHSPKAMGLVTSMAEAQDIINDIKSRIEETNDAMQKDIEKTFGETGVKVSFSPVEYRMNIIVCSGDVKVTSRAAERRISYTGKDLKNILSKYIMYLNSISIDGDKDSRLFEAHSFYNAIDDYSMYIYGVESGKQTRITYYSPDENRSLQVSMNNILIAVGDSDSAIRFNDMRKKRDDTSESIFHFIMPASDGTDKNYNIYPYDVRYLKRSKKK